MLEMLIDKLSTIRRKSHWVIWCKKERKLFFVALVPPIIPHE
jgi:hypothetical protein